MRVYKCDRCGKFFKRDELMVMTAPILPVYFNFRIKRHVCGECAKSFRSGCTSARTAGACAMRYTASSSTARIVAPRCKNENLR